MKLTVALATFNEEENIKRCLSSVKEIADEIVVVDGTSSDKTVEIARQFGAKVFIKDNPTMFHINKQKAIDLSNGDWVLQLDADERVSAKLSEEIKKIIKMTDPEIEGYEKSTPELLLRHQKAVEERDGNIGDNEKTYAAFFVPRLNYFLRKYLK